MNISNTHRRDRCGRYSRVIGGLDPSEPQKSEIPRFVGSIPQISGSMGFRTENAIVCPWEVSIASCDLVRVVVAARGGGFQKISYRSYQNNGFEEFWVSESGSTGFITRIWVMFWAEIMDFHKSLEICGNSLIQKIHGLISSFVTYNPVFWNLHPYLRRKTQRNGLKNGLMCA